MDTKRPYTEPRILKVQLNPEQAVLSACSSKAGGLDATGAWVMCGAKCRKYRAGGDGAATS